MSHENSILFKKYQSISKMVAATYVPDSSQHNCYFKQDTFIIQCQLLIQHPSTLVNTAIAIKSHVLNPHIYQSYGF